MSRLAYVLTEVYNIISHKDQKRIFPKRIQFETKKQSRTKTPQLSYVIKCIFFDILQTILEILETYNSIRLTYKIACL